MRTPTGVATSAGTLFSIKDPSPRMEIKIYYEHPKLLLLISDLLQFYNPEAHQASFSLGTKCCFIGGKEAEA
jgi:hypothetical protein